MDQSALSLANAMHKDIYGGNVNGVRAVLIQGGSPNFILEDSTRLTPLIFATCRGQGAIVEELIKFKVDLDLKDKKEMTALMCACVKDEHGILSQLVTAGADIRAVDSHGKTAFLHAAQAGSVKCLQDLVCDYGVDVNESDAKKTSAVALAALRRDSECLQLLLKLGADGNQVDEQGNCPLLLAIHRSLPTNAHILLDKLVEVNVINKEGKTPMTKAFEQIINPNMKLVLKKLLLNGAMPSLCKLDEDYLHEMIARGELEIVRQMIINGCSPRLRHCKENIFDFVISDMVSPLAVALLSNQLAIAKYLLSNSFLTQYDIHQLSKNHEIVKALTSQKLFHCSSLLNYISSNPFPLETISLTAVLRFFYNCDDNLKDSIKSQLPNRMLKRLLFQTKCAFLCLHEWETLPVDLTGYRLQECPLNHCQQRQGTRFVRD